MSPMQEATRDGFKGFVKGMGKGVIGAVVKPVAGVVDMAEELSTGRTARKGGFFRGPFLGHVDNAR